MENFQRSKIEQIDKDVTHVMRTSWKKVKGKMTGLGKSTQKKKLRAKVLCWKDIVRKKEGEHASRGLLQKARTQLKSIMIRMLKQMLRKIDYKKLNIIGMNMLKKK